MPSAEDGPAVSRLIAECPPLDPNSAYCNLLQCTHFAESCVVAERDGRLLGWLSAYRPPAAPDEIFVWQVAVHGAARGQGLGQRLINTLLSRPVSRGATRLTTTITGDNGASWALFTAFARGHDARIDRRPMFDRDAHFAGRHETEHLVSIAPINAGH
ncbi:MAG TPA: diaminobutyrate acetyltransferase [Sphingomonadaceae bacterium]|nr:diaminobutyrate acetyltransferase [Sphingomonadaceae bacterium]